MIQEGLEYFYVTNGLALVLLRVPYDNPSTLLYYLCEPNLDMDMEDDRNFQQPTESPSDNHNPRVALPNHVEIGLPEHCRNSSDGVIAVNISAKLDTLASTNQNAALSIEFQLPSDRFKLISLCA